MKSLELSPVLSLAYVLHGRVDVKEYWKKYSKFSGNLFVEQGQSSI